MKDCLSPSYVLTGDLVVPRHQTLHRHGPEKRSGEQSAGEAIYRLHQGNHKFNSQSSQAVYLDNHESASDRVSKRESGKGRVGEEIILASWKQINEDLPVIQWTREGTRHKYI